MPPEPTRPESYGSSEIEIRRYEARMGLYKVIVGTMLVGVLGAVLTFIVDIYTSYRGEKADYRAYIDRYTQTALNQDIELRLRFAEYFSLLADEATRPQWLEYHSKLATIRNRARDEILRLSEQIDRMRALPDSQLDIDQQIRLAELRRRRNWVRSAIGAQPFEYVITRRETAPPGTPAATETEAEQLASFDAWLREQGVDTLSAETLLGPATARRDCAALPRVPPRRLWEEGLPLARLIARLQVELGDGFTVLGSYRSNAVQFCLTGRKGDNPFAGFLAAEIALERLEPAGLAERLDAFKAAAAVPFATEIRDDRVLLSLHP